MSLLAFLAAAAAVAQEAGEEPGAPGRASEPAPAGEDPQSRPLRDPDERPQAERRIALDVELSPWYTGPGGRFILPGETRGGRDIDVEHLNLDSPRLSPAGRVRLEVDNWSFNLSGAQFRTDRRTVSPVTRAIGDIDLNEGDAVRTRMQFTTAELTVGNTFFQRSLYAFDYPQSRLGVALEASLGARLDHFDIKLERDAGGEASADEFFLLPLAGLEARLKPSPRTMLTWAVTAGWNPGLGDQSAITSDILVRAAWQPTPRVEVLAGYRISIQRMVTGDEPERFEFNGSHAGLFGGVQIRF